MKHTFFPLKNFKEVKMTNLDRLKIELSEKEYFKNTQEIYCSILEENGLDPFDTYAKANDEISMLESVYSVLRMLSNNIDVFRKVETEFVTTSAAYQYLQKRLKDLREEIDCLKKDLHYEDASGNVSQLVSHMWFNSTGTIQQKSNSSSGSNSGNSDSVIYFDDMLDK